MSLKSLKNSSRTSHQFLKSGQVLYIETQEQFNLLSELTGQFQVDSICISEPYFARLDEINAIQVYPVSGECEDSQNILSYTEAHIGKVVEFDKWYKKIKRK